jgi:plastocyanin
VKIKKIIFISIFAVSLLAVLAAFSGCASSGQAASTSAAGQTTAAATTAAGPIVTLETNPASKNEILIESNSFKPDNITIKAGDTITWTNKDSYNHTVTGNNAEFDSGNIASGAKFSFTFSKEGSYKYHCSIHTSMTGTITVTK